MSSDKFNPQDVIKIIETDYADTANKCLDLGWVLLGTFSIQSSEHHYSSQYSLGWMKQNGEVKYPKDTVESTWEKMKSDALKDESIPF